MGRQLAEIKAGDRVWVGWGQHPRAHGIQPVKKITPTQIVLRESREFDRYDRLKGYQRGMGMNANFISGIATPEEIIAWEAEQAQKAAEAKAREERREAEEALRKELRNLFGKSIWVSGGLQDGWVLNGLTEEQVRQIASVLREKASL